jgi:hypothetical protein
MARQYKTLGTLVADLRGLTGFASAGAVAGANHALVKLHLQNAQTILYWTHDWAHLRDYEDISIGVNQYLSDYPATCNPDRVKAISVLRAGVWSPPIPKGISPEMYTTQDNLSWPQRWEPYEQIETFPKADQIYTARVFFIRNLLAFTDENDRASIDDTMITLLATGTLKAHYRHPDAKIHTDSSEALLVRLKAKSWGKDVFRPRDYEQEVLTKPVTV